MSATFREKLPSALAAIALQVGLVALLALSFEAVRRMDDAKETTLILPPLATPKRPAPMVIDARGKRTPQPAPAPAPPPQSIEPAPAAPTSATPQTGIGEKPAEADCVPQGQARPAYRIACPPPKPLAQANPDEIPLHPESHVKNEEYWAAEKARRDAPITLPGASGGPLGILLTALLNPSAFADKRNYIDGPPLPSTGPAPDPAPGHSHVSDADFQKALQAVNDRKRALAGKPAPGQSETGAAP